MKRLKLHKKIIPQPCEVPYPGVSILKPLMGVDPHLFGNLESFFTMNYPIVSFPMDVVIAFILVLKSGEQVGVNPKINNMQPGYAAAKYELIMISDSGIRMKEDTLLDMVYHMTENVGLVHQMPFSSDREGFAASLEKVPMKTFHFMETALKLYLSPGIVFQIYFGTVQARIYLAADFVRVNCHTGMSTLMRKSLIDEVGGIKAFGCYLAEDFFFAKSLTDRGWRLCISSQPAWQNSGICDVSSFQARLTR
ncbi:hypothetical protein J437_LFUL014857 [Ladona fulva]|uniref:ceramide glucosyltransferase n=1 Tax=Ladona fulva TaxID=123851 RepID=A0A8K0KIR1_LADFU|nr:hypothetical protein J437_LFUL014857 [Ladona fulva]